MKIKTLVLSPFQTNCYILSCEQTYEGAVIDPADEGDKIADMVEKSGIILKYILITHAHIDHVMGLSGLKKRIDAEIIMDKNEESVLENLPYQAAMFGLNIKTKTPSIDKYAQEDDVFTFGKESLRVLSTPGHSPGGIGLLGKNEVFVGDTLFQGSIGRTDLYGASQEKLFDSIKTKLFTLDDHIIVYPGHGPSSTIGHEKKTNPFFTEGGFFKYI